MKIGPKIALFYSLITMCAIIMVMSVFYLFSSRYINRLYESYLREKAFITAQKYWEKDEVDEQSYRLIQQKYDELLPQAREVLLNMDTLAHVKDTLGKYLNASQQERLFHGDGTPVTFKYKKELGAALYYPDNEGYFIVFVFSENTYGKEIQEHILLLSVTLVVISSIFIFFIGRVYSNRILTPLQHILKELKRIRANNLNVRLRSYGNKDELDQLIVSLNGMLDRIDTAFKSEKSFVSNASHELNNPLTAIQGECEIALLKERSTSEYMDSLERISVESKRISLLIKSLLFLSRQDKDILANTVEDVCLPRMLREQYAGRPRIRLSSTLREENDFIVRANPYLLGIALQNVVDFLFNTLNVIQQTAGTETAYRTQALIMALSHLLRYSLMSNDEQVPLSREVRIVDEYYSIYHVRFGERVRMEWRISDSLDLTETMVPSFILQPIVENAFKHGICPKEEGGVVRIRVNPLREKGLLCIRVVDNGVGIQLDQLRQLRGALSQPGERWEHIGIYNVAARLRLLDRNSRFVIRSHPGRGTAVVLYLPLVENEEEFEE